jgi:hypothetical protein
VLWLAVTPTFGQQAGAIAGTVSMDGVGIAGVIVEATSGVLPQPRRVTTAAGGGYRLAPLPPGDYEVTFGSTERRRVAVALQQTTTIDVDLVLAVHAEVMAVVAGASLVGTPTAELSASLDRALLDRLPVGQDYRDLVRLIPGVQVTPDRVRGPSAGGSGQDNVYQFDGVNVSLPLFGTLSAEPAAHDVDQVTVVKGGASAVGFNRSGGLTINTVSRSGTNDWHGALSYQVQNDRMTAARHTGSAAVFAEDQDWAQASLAGPLLPGRLHLFASYYAPTASRRNRANLYGEVPAYASDRDEGFAKLSYAAGESLLVNASLRSSRRTERGASVGGEAAAGSSSVGSRASLEIGIVDVTWLLDERSFATARLTDFANRTAGRPDQALGFAARLDGSIDLEIANLDRMGLLTVPVPIAGQDAFNAFVAPLVDRYGYVQNGTRVGGGRVGVGAESNDQDFYRRGYEGSYDASLGSTITHEIHLGYQALRDEEDLRRASNGWGLLTVPGGRATCPVGSSCAGQAVYFQAQVQQQGVVTADGTLVPVVHSEYRSQSVEVNDTLRWRDVTVNVGLLASNDRLYGQGLRRNAGNLSGFELAPGHRYLMHEIGFRESLQPRLGAVWAYHDADTVSLSYARYVPAASSLPRAASWARNAAALVNAYFGADGSFLGASPEASSSGKFFAGDLSPRKTDEILIATARDLGRGWGLRAHARYRHSYDFWEDTNNDARALFAPPPGIPRELYIANLDALRAEIGGSSFVIARLDGAFTKHYEAGLEAAWRGSGAYLRGSYVWSHYYGNFDQDNTTSALNNDGNIFIGSSNLADDAGRQLWNFKYGDLRGDRRHQVKLFGTYALPWQASIGAVAIYQSGQPWERQDVELYRALTTSTSDVNRYAEPAGSRRTAGHHQLDLDYAQDFRLGSRVRLQLRLDVFNLFDRQTGYNVRNLAHGANFGQPQSFWEPRRFQVALKLEV